MSTDGTLFGGDDPNPKPAPQPTPPPRIAAWQVEQLRGALAARGLEDMAQRQHLVEQLVGRSVPALRDLSWAEARTLHEQLAKRAPSPKSNGPSSSWDERDEDTWIDRL